MAIARNLSRSLAVFFLDVCNAFGSVYRYFITGTPLSDEAVAKIFSDLNFGPEVFALFQRFASMPCALAEAEVPSELIHL